MSAQVVSSRSRAGRSRQASDVSVVVEPASEVATLENGLVVIVREDHSAPVVSVQAWCRTGSIHEGRWLGAGLSHVLEHMLFKGTGKRPGNRIDLEVQEAGGSMNAYTSFDRTVYYVNVPSTGARTAVDILCDIMQDASLPDDELARELDVIRREMDMNQDDPGRRSGRRLFETAYTVSPYRHTIIGYPDIFNELKPGDIRGYYRDRYVPNNTFFVVTGDVKASEVLAQVRQAYAGVKARALPSMVLPTEPAQMAARELVEEDAVELGYAHMAWHIPDLRHADVPLIDVLSTLLGSGRSSRLYRKVREELALVHYVDAWTYSPGNPGMVGISAVMDGSRYGEARSALLAEVERLKTRGVTAGELEKAKKQFLSGTLSARKTMQGQAQDLGSNWMTTQDLGFSSRYLEAVRRATPAELQRVARRYFAESNRTIYALLPRGSKSSAPVDVEVIERREVEKVELPNGLRLLIKEDHRLPFVEIRTVFLGGVLAENAATSGITQVATRLLLKGTKSRSAEAISEEIESVGGSIDTYGGNNSFGVNLEVLRSDFGLGLDLAADVLLRPTFPEGALEREREVQLATIRGHRDDLLRSATTLMRRTLFGDAGYGLEGSGSEASVKALKREDLLRFHRERVSPANGVMAVYGAVERDAVVAEVKRRFGRWPARVASARRSELAAGTASGGGLRRVTDTREKKQAVLVIAFPGVALNDGRRYALDLMQEACSDLGSRLFVRIRDRLGLAYYVGAQHLTGLAPGYFAFYVGTDPAKADLVERELLAEAGKLREEGLADEELARAKAKIVGGHKISRQELGSLATTTALDELYGLGYRHHQTEDALYEAVTAKEVRDVAAQILDERSVVVARVLPAGQ